MDPITVRDAIIEAGGVQRLADRLAVTRQTIHRWGREEPQTLPETYAYRFIATVKRKR